MVALASPGTTTSIYGSSAPASTNRFSARRSTIANAWQCSADIEHRVHRVKFDLFYHLLAAESQNPSARYRELVAEAVEADRLGFDTLWLAEVHFTPRFSVMPAPLLQLAAIAERTTRLRLWSAVNPVPLHH